jgi:hypothetical protein
VITYAQLNTILSERLDDEASERYLLSNRLAAINSAISRAQTALGWELANRKGSEESLREFTRIVIFQTDLQRSSFLIDDPLLGYKVANVVAIYPEPEAEFQPTTITVPALPTPVVIDVPANPNPLPLPPTMSRYRADAVWQGAGKPARRVTHEQVPVIKDNVHMPGNEVFASNASRRTYSYYVNEGRVYLLPRSVTAQKFVGMAHIKKFEPMTDDTSTVDMPESTLYLLASWAMQYIAWKQDPQMVGHGAIAEKDAAELFAMTTNR